MVLNKIDLLEMVDFDMEKAKRSQGNKPNLPIFELSARNGRGLDAWLDWLRAQVVQVISPLEFRRLV